MSALPNALRAPIVRSVDLSLPSTFLAVSEVIGDDLTRTILEVFKPALPRANGSYSVCIGVPKAKNLGKSAQVYGHRLIDAIGREAAMKLSQAYGGEILWIANPDGAKAPPDANAAVWVWSSDHGWLQSQQMDLFDF